MTFAWLVLSILAIAAGIGAAYRVQAKRLSPPTQEISSTPPAGDEPDPEEPSQPPTERPTEATPTEPTAPAQEEDPIPVPPVEATPPTTLAQEEDPIPVPPVAEPVAVEVLLEEIEQHPEQEPA